MKMVLSQRISREYHIALQQEFPEIEFIHAQSTSEALSLAPGIDIAIDLRTRDFIEVATKLQWIQTVSAGVNGAPFDLLKERGVLLTNAAANYGPNMADHTLALMLMLARQIDTARHRMRTEGWKCRRPAPDPGELAGQTLLIIGLGGIGLETLNAVGYEGWVTSEFSAYAHTSAGASSHANMEYLWTVGCRETPQAPYPVGVSPAGEGAGRRAW